MTEYERQCAERRARLRLGPPMRYVSVHYNHKHTALPRTVGYEQCNDPTVNRLVCEGPIDPDRVRTIEQALDYVRELVLIDVQHVNIFQMLTKMTEELGEFATELQIEEGVLGKGARVPNEGSIGEAIDVIIMALALYYARNGSPKATAELTERLMKKLRKWQKRQEAELQTAL